MYSTKLSNIFQTPEMGSYQWRFTPIAPASLLLSHNVYLRYSRIAMEVRHYLEIGNEMEESSMLEKLSASQGITSIYQTIPITSGQHSVTRRRQEISPYHYLRQSTENLVNEQFRGHQSPIERHMNQFGCSRQEAKAMTFGERYGSIKILKGREAPNSEHSYQYCSLDFGHVERCASVFWIDDV